MASICHREINIDRETGDEYIITEDSKEPITNWSDFESWKEFEKSEMEYLPILVAYLENQFD